VLGCRVKGAPLTKSIYHDFANSRARICGNFPSTSLAILTSRTHLQRACNGIVRTTFAGLCFGVAVVFATQGPGSFTNVADVWDAALFAAMFSFGA
jgi:hypothetical protein